MSLRNIFEESFVGFLGDESFINFGDDQSISFKFEFEKKKGFESELIKSSEEKNKDESKKMFSYFEPSPIEKVSEKEISEKSSKTEISIKSTECKKLIGKKRGREPKKGNINNKPHTKYKADNIKRTIQVHFLTFLIQLLNTIMNSLNLNYSFKNLHYDYKKNTKNSNIKEMKSKTIKEILLEAPVTDKFTKINKNYNIEQIRKIEKTNQYLFKFLDKTYLDIFENIYLKNLKTINLDLLNNNCVEIDISQNVNNFEKIKKNYLLDKQKLDKIVKNYYLK